MKTYQHLFFDLDHTLWDYDRNVSESLQELYEIYTLKELGIPTFEKFFEAFHAVNFKLWDWYNIGKIDKINLRKERFPMIFSHAGGRVDAIPLEFEEDFMHRTSSKPHVFPYSKEILTYLKEKYRVHVITNGFNESQAKKMKSSGLDVFFELVVTSETTGHKKPDVRIFEYALTELKTHPEHCLMIGDNPNSDILGAQQAQIDQVYFNPEGKTIALTPTYEIRHLRELEQLL
ncbi:YjjG family noncanonical pyrimidine nucleotidase [Algoriphagus sp. NF]|uniref:YjjG family noncanonical pyrimidine nucleotidase n=1 Tax=Algoriphagus sp. NF TaxID=2992756 RepID=UPI00237C15CE|nr:YjjG family noncanonical pyrimidine nucleotidase [Algoriphagus sp. NF]MCR9082915.1 YjjG family noncanonical pyrimidine nucleotidase [Cyclobacteriaceae bacterium]MDE0559272.1 YjjG family noncanonical pyrimidine nucleotidase [Algoriphagus sp. NF]